MASNNDNSTGCTVYIGNLDEKVSERVLYDILIQAGRVVDLYIPRDKENDRPRGYAFAEYETEEIADYAVRLFSGLVTLYNRTLRFAISGQDKPSTTLPTAALPMPNSSNKHRLNPVPYHDMEVSAHSARLSASCRVSAHHLNDVQVSHGVTNHHYGYRSHYDSNNYDYSRRSHYDSDDYDYSRRVFGSVLNGISHSRSGRYGSSNPTGYPC